MSQPLVRFRCDAAPAIGIGHVARCLALADHLAAAGWQVRFAVSPDTPASAAMLSAAGYPLDPPEAAADPADLLIVDGYQFDHAWEQAHRRAARRLLVIDDMADRAHDCDLLLDQCAGRRAADYAALVPDGTEIFAGPAYALLRQDFRRARRNLRRRARLDRVLIAFGGTDPAGATVRAIAGLPADLPADIVIGRAMVHRAAVEAAVEAAGGRLTLHVDSTRMPDLAAAADLAIGAPGVAALERCCLGLPALLIVIAENQRPQAAGLTDAGAALRLPDDATPAQIHAAVQALRGDPAALGALSDAAAALVDGRGPERLAARLAGPRPDRDGRPVRLRAAETADAKLLFDWQSLPGTRRYARNPDLPDWDGHCAWLSRTLANPDIRLCVVMHGAVPAGAVRLDRLTTGGHDVAIYLDPALQGRGLGKAALALLRDLQPAGTLHADVHVENAASQALFTAAGYRRTDNPRQFLHDPVPEPQS